MPLRRSLLSLLAALHLVLAPSAAMAQELEVDPADDAGGTWWTIPALALIVVLAIAVLFLVVKRRHQVPSLDDRLPEVAEETARSEIRSEADRSDMPPDVLRLLESPAVAPQPGGAADLSADPWTETG